MSWAGPNLTFWLVTVIVVVPAFYAAFTPSILRAAFSLFFTLFGMAGYYILLGSDFVAVTQVIIYVGGILVLLVFGVLLTTRPWPSPDSLSRTTGIVMCVPAFLLAGVLGWMILTAGWITVPVDTEPESSLRPLGAILLGKYLPVLEISGLTLLLCLIGAAFLLRRNER